MSHGVDDARVNYPRAQAVGMPAMLGKSAATSDQSRLDGALCRARDLTESAFNLALKLDAGVDRLVGNEDHDAGPVGPPRCGSLGQLEDHNDALGRLCKQLDHTLTRLNRAV